jgi:hypothetical protein
MGRNPLAHLQKQTAQSVNPRAPLSAPFSTRPPSTRMTVLQASLEKVKEMQIQVDWRELYRSTLGQPVKKFLRILSLN